MSVGLQVKRLQKHQAFQAEVSAHEGRLHEIQHAGETLIAKRHAASHEIHQQLDKSQNGWKQLLVASNLLGRGLEEVSSYTFHFYLHVFHSVFILTVDTFRFHFRSFPVFLIHDFFFSMNRHRTFWISTRRWKKQRPGSETKNL